LKEVKGSGGLLDPSQEGLPIPDPSVFEIPGVIFPIGFHVRDGLESIKEMAGRSHQDCIGVKFLFSIAAEMMNGCNDFSPGDETDVGVIRVV
jgi:hypothetical protein